MARTATTKTPTARAKPKRRGPTICPGCSRPRTYERVLIEKIEGSCTCLLGAASGTPPPVPDPTAVGLDLSPSPPEVESIVIDDADDHFSEAARTSPASGPTIIPEDPDEEIPDDPIDEIEVKSAVVPSGTTGSDTEELVLGDEEEIELDADLNIATPPPILAAPVPTSRKAGKPAGRNTMRAADEDEVKRIAATTARETATTVATDVVRGSNRLSLGLMVLAVLGLLLLLGGYNWWYGEVVEPPPVTAQAEVPAPPPTVASEEPEPTAPIVAQNQIEVMACVKNDGKPKRETVGPGCYWTRLDTPWSEYGVESYVVCGIGPAKTGDDAPNGACASIASKKAIPTAKISEVTSTDMKSVWLDPQTGTGGRPDFTVRCDKTTHGSCVAKKFASN